ncbi:AbrB family transcriptional regulator [Fundicoccus sp. Sow4_F4]|uniref:AbrB family transcriptional regulator n=1 Tax=Fundicoccus sp. Sow4_F4 TaxID=3438783 RepID=UPI003F903F10
MESYLMMAITLALAILVGHGFMKARIPGGLLVGVMLVFATMQVLTGTLWAPPGTKEIAQMIAGSFIGASLSTADLKRLPRLWKAFATIICGLIILNITIGLLLTQVSELSLVTALFASIPGGMGTIPIISQDYGADPITVTVMQFIRMVMGIGVFPSLVVKLNQHFKTDQRADTQNQEPTPQSTLARIRPINSLLALVAASLFAWAASQFLTGLNLMVLALIGMAILKLTIGVTPLPIGYRRLAQILSGWYVGTTFYAEQLSALSQLVVPILVLIPMFLLGCLVIGFLVHKFQKMRLTDSMLASIPAGASDVVLILGDLNITNSDIVVLQVLRVIVVTSLFPQIAVFINHWLG